jgi:hypothetical protein
MANCSISHDLRLGGPRIQKSTEVSPDWKEVKKDWEVWELICNELGTTDKDKLVTEAEGYFKQKPGIYDNLDSMNKYKTPKSQVWFTQETIGLFEFRKVAPAVVNTSRYL